MKQPQVRTGSCSACSVVIVVSLWRGSAIGELWTGRARRIGPALAIPGDAEHAQDVLRNNPVLGTDTQHSDAERLNLAAAGLLSDDALCDAEGLAERRQVRGGRQRQQLVAR